MDKEEEFTDAMRDDMITGMVDKAVKHAVTTAAVTIIYKVVHNMLKTDPTVSGLKETIKRDLMKSVNTKIEMLVNERTRKSNEDALTKASLQTELEMAKKLSVTRAAIIQKLEGHLELRSRMFEDFSSLLESTCIDNGEDGLGADGPHTTNLNIAHIINDRDDELLKQIIEQLQAELPGNAEICEIEADIAKIVAREEAIKEEAATHDAH